MAGLKKCKDCEDELPESDFPRDGKFRRPRCNDCYSKHRSKSPDITKRFFRPLSGKRYLITSAQNATKIHEPFLATLKVAAEHLDAELVVVPFRYRNPTSLWTKNNVTDEWWGTPPIKVGEDEEGNDIYEDDPDNPLKGLLFNVRKKLHKHLVLAADVKTQPTASSPLTGFEGLTGNESCIIAHPKMQFKSVPTSGTPKILSTTGTCTQLNYTDSKAGKIGEFHHFLGAIIVELVGDRFHLRQLNADRKDGSFIDLDKLYTSKGVKKAPRALGLVMGDAHARFMCPMVDAATFGEGGIVETLDPEILVWHDVHDGYATNPHHIGKPFIAQAKALGKLGNVQAEVEHCVEFIRQRTKGRQSVIVSSNHDDFLSRWIERADWKTDPINASFYLKTALAMTESVRMTPHGGEVMDPFQYWVDQLKGNAEIRCLSIDESFRLAEIECGFHGHQGPNGARGSLKNLSRLGMRVISGHAHTPGIEGGHYQVGTSTPLRLEYTHGPSSWLNTHCVVYGNGKRALITIIEGQWRGA